jgi:hypothetical protein
LALAWSAFGATVNLDGPWRFRPLPTKFLKSPEAPLIQRYSAADLADASWEQIIVPSYWDQPPGGWPWFDPNLIGGPHPDHDGEAWYRLHFSRPTVLDAYTETEVREKEVDKDWVAVLRFEGVAARTSVWLNGSFVDRHSGAHAPFEFEIAPSRLLPATNVLAVRVRDKACFYDPKLRESRDDLIPLGFDPRAGGIYRSVSLRVVPKERITDLFVLPNLQSLSIDVSVSDEAVGSTTLELTITEKATGTRIYGPRLQPVRFDHKRYQGLTVSVSNLSLAQPWSPESPNLYHLAARLLGRDKREDIREVDFGFRTVGVGRGKFLLNGRPYFLFGAGSPPHYENVSEEVARKHLEALKGAGVRMVRFAHEPPSDLWLRLCDELGLLAWVEGPLSPEGGPYDFAHAKFIDHATQEIVHMVKSLRNHPSIAVWSLASDALASVESKDPDARKAAVDFLSGLTNIVSHRLVDPTRIVIPESNNKGEIPSAIEDWHTDLGWYEGRTGDWPALLDRYAVYRDEGEGGAAPWVSSEVECGYSSCGQGIVLPDPAEEAASRMRIGTPGEDAVPLLTYQSSRIQTLIEDARAARNPEVNRVAGIFPFTSANWFFNPLTPSAFSPKPIAEAVRKAYSPVCVTLSGLRSHYYSGEVIEPTLSVANDNILGGTITSSSLVFEVFTSGRQEPSLTRREIPPLPYYSSRSHNLVLALPDTPGLDTARVRVRLVSGETELASNERTIRVANPTFCNPTPQDIAEGVALYDPNGTLEDLLKTHKVSLPAFNELDQLRTLSGLVIGPDGFDPYVGRAWPIIGEWVRSGGRLFVLAQEKNEGRWKFSGPYPGARMLSKPAGWPSGIDRVNLLEPEHPFFEGVVAEDLADWGENHVVALSVLEKTSGSEESSDRVRTLASVVPSSERLHWSDVVMEVRIGEGRVLFCQLLLVRNASPDPIAARLLKNGLRWAGGARKPILVKLPASLQAFHAPLVGNVRGEISAKGAGAGPDDPIRAVSLPDGQFKAGLFKDQGRTEHPGLVPLSTTGQISYDLDDRFWFDQAGAVEIQVQVLCRNPSRIRLDYDSADRSLGSQSVAKQASPRQVLEINTWKLLVFKFRDARFANRQYNGCDFRLVLEDGEAVFGPLTVRRLK